MGIQLHTGDWRKIGGSLNSSVHKGRGEHRVEQGRDSENTGIRIKSRLWDHMILGRGRLKGHMLSVHSTDCPNRTPTLVLGILRIAKNAS